MTEIDRESVEQLARRIKTRSPYKSAMQIACEEEVTQTDAKTVGEITVILGQGDYPTIQQIADQSTKAANDAAATLLALRAALDAAEAQVEEARAMAFDAVIANIRLDVENGDISTGAGQWIIDTIRTLMDTTHAEALERVLAKKHYQIEPLKDDNLAGPIEVGQRFIWEPHKPKAREYITVTRIVDIEGDERRIWTRSDSDGEECWNEESRFREACVRVDQERAAIRARGEG